MAFYIGKTLKIRSGPFAKAIDLTILDKVEKFLRESKRNPHIKIFSVDYRELPPNGEFRMFHIEKAFNQMDK